MTDESLAERRSFTDADLCYCKPYGFPNLGPHFHAARDADGITRANGVVVKRKSDGNTDAEPDKRAQRHE